ncbi:MAG: hypothetical protein TR69_WS6001000667 [candidate division WS6 bacterium OLB20]|uniref:Uncharacterized protein n=1 Tax=candidate division WS6 bacterium OLB20 TaxID=1617426 RepID=A0A136LYB6_9BACT|nr:MAG: hypothetical protein TR69_WS6001000667 [candidate division WS6 bacterium OLB20]
MTQSERHARLILANTAGIGRAAYTTIIERFGSASSFLSDSSSHVYKKIC